MQRLDKLFFKKLLLVRTLVPDEVAHCFARFAIVVKTKVNVNLTITQFVPGPAPFLHYTIAQNH